MADQASSPAQWLDLLPDEICETIAVRVTHGQRDSNGMTLAHTSKKLSNAVWNTVPHPIHVRFRRPDCRDRDESENEDDLAEWALAFASHEIHLEFVELTPLVAEVLQKSNVTKCSLRTENDSFFFARQPALPLNTTKLVDEVFAKQSIRCLSIELTQGANITKLFQKMSLMNLKELRLTGTLRSGEWLDELANSCTYISTRCPSLREIATSDLFIGSPEMRLRGQQDHNDTYWRAVAKLPVCCRIALHNDPPDRLIRKLRTFRGVEVFFVSPEKASQFSRSVISYTCLIMSRFEARALDPLKECIHLKELDLSLESEAIRYLPKILRHLKSLCILKLTQEDNTKAPEGSLPDIARAAPLLTELTVSVIPFSPSQWKSALGVFGRRLRSLAIWVELYDEDETFDEQVDRLELILVTLLRCNRCLKEFSFGRIDCPAEMREHGQEKYDSIMALVSRVQDAIPCLENGSLKDRCGNMIFIPEAEE